MNLALLPLVVVALLLASADPEADSLQLLLAGEQHVAALEGGLIVGEARVTVPDGATLSGPVYVIGGELRVAGTIEGDVTQLAGTVLVEPGAVVAGELLHVAGTLTVSGGASVGRRSTVDLSRVGEGGGGLATQATLTVLLALAGYLVARARPAALANVAAAARDHPFVSLTVGTLISLTAVALLVFMAFTLVLLPVTLIGLFAGLVTLGYGLIALGHWLGTRLPVLSPAAATGVGVALLLMGLGLVGRVPLVGDLVVGGVVLVGAGAALITYYGATRFQPDPLPG